MKFYKPSPPDTVIRLQIKKQGCNTEYINLCDTTVNKTVIFVKKVIEKQNLSPFVKGNVCSVNIRRSVGGENLESKSVSFKGLNPSEVAKLIVDAVMSYNFI